MLQEKMINPYPFGWYRICDRLDLNSKFPFAARLLGKELVAFRSKDGTPHVMDAYCPHLGAHLKDAKLTSEGRIRCPFHGWSFDGTGHCMNAPFASKTPKARITTYPVTEIDDIVFFYYSAHGEEPCFTLEGHPELSRGSWGKSKNWSQRVPVHIQEIRENGFDRTHFFELHRKALLKEQAELPIIEDWTLSDNSMRLDFSFILNANLIWKKTKMRLRLSFFGPGYLRIEVTDPICFIISLPVTPLDNGKESLYCHRTWVKPSLLSPVIHWFLHQQLTREVKQDIVIWKSKKYLSQPYLSSADEFIFKFRKWMQIFYELPQVTSRSAKLSMLSRE